jgi:Mn2+/Fe2+ NRAMP family transporter
VVEPYAKKNLLEVDMQNTIFTQRQPQGLNTAWQKLRAFFTVFGPATITAMADNDASGVVTYAVAGATLGYPILFLLLLITILLAITQEMGIRLTVVTGKGLADHIREVFGVRAAVFMFVTLIVANLGILIVDATAVKVTAEIFQWPPAPVIVITLLVAYLVIVKGNYKITQALMLIGCLFFGVYIFSAVKARPNWSHALTNLVYPHGVKFDLAYLRITSLSVWACWGLPSRTGVSSSSAASRTTSALRRTRWAWRRAKPMAALLFGLGILNAGFMGLVVVSLSTAMLFRSSSVCRAV